MAVAAALAAKALNGLLGWTRGRGLALGDAAGRTESVAVRPDQGHSVCRQGQQAAHTIGQNERADGHQHDSIEAIRAWGVASFAPAPGDGEQQPIVEAAHEGLADKDGGRVGRP